MRKILQNLEVLSWYFRKDQGKGLDWVSNVREEIPMGCVGKAPGENFDTIMQNNPREGFLATPFFLVGFPWFYPLQQKNQKSA